LSGRSIWGCFPFILPAQFRLKSWIWSRSIIIYKINRQYSVYVRKTTITKRCQKQMKKQIGLIALSAILVACVAFSGVASAQTASNVQVAFFYSPMCSICEQVKPLVESAAAQTGAKLTEYNVADTSLGQGVAQANGVTGTPTIVISPGGQRLVGEVTEQQIVTAIQAAAGSTTPTPAATPTAVAVVKATPEHKVVIAKPAPEHKVVVVKPKPQHRSTNTQPAIAVVPATQTPTASTQTVPEFSLLGLGAPALVVGAIYLFLRKR